MNSGLGSFFYGNWKNKAVALFFAISIWFLAYQSETRSISRTIRVRFQPLNTMSTAIVGVRFSENEKFDLANGAEVPVRVELTGPRKQIDKIDDGEFPVRVISL